MGYYTTFTVTVKSDAVPLTEQPVVKDIVAFMQRAGIEFREETAGRMVTELSRHFVGLPSVETICKRLMEIADYHFSIDDNELTTDSIKWYDCQEHMAQLSREFPAFTFDVSGEGEEQGDVWKQTFKAGVASTKKRARMVFDDED